MLLVAVRRWVGRLFAGECGSHDGEHTERVVLLARECHRFMQTFFSRLTREVDGKA